VLSDYCFGLSFDMQSAPAIHHATCTCQAANDETLGAGWENPLTWSAGDFFGPKLKGPRGRVCLPPPVLLSQVKHRLLLRRAPSASPNAVLG
jgi:hypothetical protein